MRKRSDQTTPSQTAPSSRTRSSMSAARGAVAELRREHGQLVHEYGEARARVREYTSRGFLRPGERLEARTLERLTQHKRSALGDVGKRLTELEARASGLAAGGDR